MDKTNYMNDFEFSFYFNHDVFGNKLLQQGMLANAITKETKPSDELNVTASIYGMEI